MPTFTGELLRRSPDGAEGVFRRRKQGDDYAVTFADPPAALAMLNPGMSYRVHTASGREAEATFWQVIAPTENELAAGISRMRIQGIGHERAAAIAHAAVQQKIIGRLHEEPGALTELHVPGVPAVELSVIASRYGAGGVRTNLRRVYALLAPLGASMTVVEAITDALEEAGVSVPFDQYLREHPYWALHGDIGEDVSLRLCDALDTATSGRSDPQDGEPRLRAAVAAALHGRERNGDTAAPRGTVVGIASGILAAWWKENRTDHEERKAAYAKEVAAYLYGRTDKLFPSRTIEGKNYIQRAIQAKYEWKAVDGIDRSLRHYQEACLLPSLPDNLDPSQQAALRHILTHPLTILTGGAGTGKTRVLQEAVRLYGWPEEVAVTATTGKAAHVLSPHDGKTLHHFLDIRPHQLPERFPENRRIGLLVVDECSMLDSSLAGALGVFLRDAGCQHLVLAGDIAQLPPVGPGAPFWDFADEFNDTAFVALEVNHRTIGRGIADLGAFIRDGSLHQPPSSTEDITVIECPSSSIPDAVTAEVQRLLSSGMRPDDILVLTAQHGGPTGNKSLAYRLRPLLLAGANPTGADRFVVGDRVIQDKTATMGDQTILNGSFGTVASYDGRTARVQFDWNGAVEVPARQAHANLQLAYALTVHKAQGSQAPDVIVVLDPTAARWGTDKAMSYTAVTRAQQHLTLIGDPSLLVQAAHATEQRRLTLLRDKFGSKRADEVVH